jgi:hypothetical protein
MALSVLPPVIRIQESKERSAKIFLSDSIYLLPRETNSCKTSLESKGQRRTYQRIIRAMVLLMLRWNLDRFITFLSLQTSMGMVFLLLKIRMCRREWNWYHGHKEPRKF